MDRTDDRRATAPAGDDVADADSISASEALTFLAFGEERAMAWRDHDPVARLLRKLGPSHPAARLLMEQPFGDPRGLLDALNADAALNRLTATGVALREALAGELAEEPKRREALQRATTSLLRAGRTRDVAVWGRPDRVPGVTDHTAPHVRVPVEVLVDPKVTVTLHDRIQDDPTLLNGGIRGGPGYGDVRFWRGEVRALRKRLHPRAGAHATTPVESLQNPGRIDAPDAGSPTASHPHGEAGPSRRRTRAPTGWALADEEIVRSVMRMVERGQAPSHHAAALKLAKEGCVPGAGTPESKAKRICSRIPKPRAGD